MLVLSRKIGEKIVVDDRVTIVINRISGNRVSLGIIAPPGVRVIRSELDPLPTTQARQPESAAGFTPPAAPPSSPNAPPNLAHNPVPTLPAPPIVAAPWPVTD